MYGRTPSKRAHNLIPVVVTCLVLLGCQSPGPPGEPGPIGTVIAAIGSPSVTRQSRNYIIDVHSRIYEGDIVRTNASSRTAIEMVDESIMQVGPGSHLVLHEYRFAPGEAPAARVTLASGSLEASTRFNTDARRPTFRIRTPLADIAVRGGEFWSGFIFGANALDVAVLAGLGLLVTNDHGSVELGRRGHGTTVIGATAPQPAQRWTQLKLDRALSETMIRPL